MAIDPEAVEISTLTEYTPEVARQLGELTMFLSEDCTGKPVPEDLLRGIIESNSSEQLVATVAGRIVGAAILNHIRGITGEQAYLVDFVAHEDLRGEGVGYMLWEKMAEWCLGRSLGSMAFTSNYEDAAANMFYRLQDVQACTRSVPRRVFFTKPD